MAVLKLTLQRTYHKMGFFNVPVSHDKYVRPTEGQVRIRLGRDGEEIEGRVDRHANRNGTARVLGGSRLKGWFQSACKPMDAVTVEFVSLELIILAVG
jgi:hypothetical protein